MVTKRTTFRKPPLQETAISIQFEPQREFSNSLIGEFWAAKLKSVYSNLPQDDHVVPEQFELFGPEMRLGSRLSQVWIHNQLSTRLRATTPDLTRMVQVQNGRLIVNWLKTETHDYPRFSKTQEELLRVYDLLTDFLVESGLQNPHSNQWEVTYVNHIVQGTLWNQSEDIYRLFPGLFASSRPTTSYKFESVDAKWRFQLPEQRGRLHVDLSHGWKERDPTSTQLIVFQLTARGPIHAVNDPDVADKHQGLKSGLNLGHESIVQTFTECTSKEAHALWEFINE